MTFSSGVWVVLVVLGIIGWTYDLAVSRPKRLRKARAVKRELYGDGPIE
jgi:hypothetical protein